MIVESCSHRLMQMAFLSLIQFGLNMELANSAMQFCFALQMALLVQASLLAWYQLTAMNLQE